MTKAEIVAKFAERLFGEHWTQPLSDFTGLNLRTCQRIKAAAHMGEEYGSAKGALDALIDAVSGLADDLCAEMVKGD